MWMADDRPVSNNAAGTYAGNQKRGNDRQEMKMMEHRVISDPHTNGGSRGTRTEEKSTNKREAPEEGKSHVKERRDTYKSDEEFTQVSSMKKCFRCVRVCVLCVYVFVCNV